MDARDEVLQLARALIRIDTSTPPGRETPAAELIRDVLTDAGVDADLVARDPDRANVVARIPGTDPSAPSLAFVGHLDVVPADPRDWTHPPFEAVVDDDGYLYGRGAVDMKNEVAARTVAMARLGRAVRAGGRRPRGDLVLIMVSDEEDGRARTGMEWLVGALPELRTDHAVNEGGGSRLELADGRVVHTLSTGEKGTYPARLTARGEAGHASMPTIGRNAVPILARLLDRLGDGLPAPAIPEITRPFLAGLLGESVAAVAEASGPAEQAALLARAAALHPGLAHVVPVLAGTTTAPTMLSAGLRLNVMPARASAEVDCRVLPGATPEQVEAHLRDRLGDGVELPYDLEWIDRFTAGTSSPPDGAVPAAVQAWLDDVDPGSTVLPMICTGFTDSTHLRGAFGTAAYGYSPFLTTPAHVVESGFHNRDERVHVDDLAHSVAFHEFLAHRLLD
jgi:acetylornithine deacetylase/succinyl-diaminopimelate desuccinylase-like protein